LKLGTATVAIVLAGSFALAARAQAIPSAVTVCAGETDAENLCSWDSAAGTHGRKCALDVEHMRRTACDYSKVSLPSISDHKAMCFSVGNAEHIAFNSSQGRNFRVRRLVPITHKNAHGQACPRDPFAKTFDPTDVNFGSAFDTLAPKSSALGCQYKLEVQFQTADPNAQPEPNDQQHRHFECRDPHLRITN